MESKLTDLLRLQRDKVRFQAAYELIENLESLLAHRGNTRLRILCSLSDWLKRLKVEEEYLTEELKDDDV